MKYVDVWRQTCTNLESEHEKSIFDVWIASETDNTELSEPWVGTAKFYLPVSQPRTLTPCARRAYDRQLLNEIPDPAHKHLVPRYEWIHGICLHDSVCVGCPDGNGCLNCLCGYITTGSQNDMFLVQTVSGALITSIP